MNTEEQTERRLAAARELMRLMGAGHEIDPLAVGWASQTLSRVMGIRWSDRVHSGRIVEMLKAAGPLGCTTTDIAQQIAITENAVSKTMRMLEKAGGCFVTKHQHRVRYFLMKADADDWIRNAKSSDPNDRRNEARRARVASKKKAVSESIAVSDRETEITRYRSRTFDAGPTIKEPGKKKKDVLIVGLGDAKTTICPPCNLDRWGTRDFKGGDFVAEWREKRKSR